jgi:hypothetical protein
MNAILSFLASVAAAVTPAAFAANSGPSISTVSYPSSVTANVSTALSASVSSAVGVVSCNLYVDSDDKGSMTVSSGRASAAYTFPRGGVFTVFVFCRDRNGGMSSGAPTSVLVQGAIVEQPTYSNEDSAPAQPSQPPAEPSSEDQTASPTSSSSSLQPGMLIKLECPATAASDHPCKAVYYYGKDGKHHAFPNEKAYFTWFNNFDGVKSVDAASLGAIPFGKNVTYRPGTKMVKFQTLNSVYAVSKGGVLRWVATEAVARGLYGDDWNKKIDDVADTFYTNYAFGSDIVSAADYAAADALGSAQTVDDSL